MAKPIIELLTELQTVVEKSDAAQTSLTETRTKEQATMAAAKDAYDKVVSSSQGAIDMAQAKATESEGYVKTLQDEVNGVLGRRAENARVRVG